jgi:DNA-nicking Smr family endonuclease
MTPDDKKLWEEVAKTIKPLKKEKKEPTRKPPKDITSSPAIREEKSFIRKPVSSGSLLRPKILHSQDRLITRKLKQGSYRIEATLDLHGQTQEQAYASLERFLGWALERQFQLVLIITGKGRRISSFADVHPENVEAGVLRQRLPEWLENSDQFGGVVSVSVARPQDGGTGAWYVELKTL